MGSDDVGIKRVSAPPFDVSGDARKGARSPGYTVDRLTGGCAGILGTVVKVSVKVQIFCSLRFNI
jgi:hypothetical protein